MKMLIFAVLALLHAVSGAAIATQARMCSMTRCYDDYAPVCGTDGKTYSNQCNLKWATCMDSSITLDRMGECGHMTMAPCPAMMCMMVYQPVCGSDGKTYSNMCALHSAHCHGEVAVVRHGPCDGGLLLSK